MKYYIILFKDGCFQIYNNVPEKRDFRDDAMFYECDESTTIADISEWIGSAYSYQRKIKRIKFTVNGKIQKDIKQ